MILVFDTSALSTLLREDRSLARIVGNALYDDLVIPLATDAEARFGFAFGSKQATNLQIYDRFKRHFNVRIMRPDNDTSIIYADLATWCRQHGISLSNNDLWIAATCIQLGGQLLTLDRDFARLPQVSLVDIPA